MTANIEIGYWQTDDSWYEYDETAKTVVLTDATPVRARKSFELMLEKSREGTL